MFSGSLRIPFDNEESTQKKFVQKQGRCQGVLGTTTHVGFL